jgi:hypothetical protein
MVRRVTPEALGEELVDILLHKGTPYFLLASNMKEENYEEIRFSKDGGRVIVDMLAQDIDYPEARLHFRYTYEASGTLVCREQVLEDSIVTLWDRESEIRRLVNAIKSESADDIVQTIESCTAPEGRAELAGILAQALAV